MKGLLQGRVALVTGGSRGIGYAIAAAYVREGAKVVICGRNELHLQEAVARLQVIGDVFPVVCDVSSISQVEEMVQKAIGRYGTVDILVNNAGISMTFGRVGEIDPRLWARVVQVNLVGTFNSCHAVIPKMLSQASGKIINLKGYGANMPSPRVSAYGASKAAVLAFTRTLAREYRGSGITVNCLSPGVVKTELILNREATPEGRPYLEQFSGFIDVLANPAEKAAQLAVRMASSSTDGVSGREFRVMSKTGLALRLIKWSARRLLKG